MFEVTAPIRNFTDYGFTMCSTISGINQSRDLQHQYSEIKHRQLHVQPSRDWRGVTRAPLQDCATDPARLASGAQFSVDEQRT
jgi:hypothetical protein